MHPVSVPAAQEQEEPMDAVAWVALFGYPAAPVMAPAIAPVHQIVFVWILAT